VGYRKSSPVEQVTEDLSWILEGAGSLVHAWTSGVYVDVFDEEGEDGLPQADVGPFAKAYCRYAVPDTAANDRRAWKRLRSPVSERTNTGGKQSLPGSHVVSISRRAWHMALEDAMRTAVKDLHKFVVKEKFLRTLPQSTSLQKKFAASCRSLRQTAMRSRAVRAASWMKAARHLHANATAWMTSEMKNYVTRNDKTADMIALNRRLATILQYASLMQGNWEGTEVTAPVRHLRDICAALVGTLRDASLRKPSQKKTQSVTKNEGGSSGDPRRLGMLDEGVLGKDQVDRWRVSLGDKAVVIGKVVAEIVRPTNGVKPQSGPWWRREYIDVFARHWPTAKNNKRGSLNDAFVNKCLTPLQGLGLAAQIPSDLWRRANELEAVILSGGEVRTVKPLKTSGSHKWILSPLAAVLADDS
jgi:hypothetical protein